MIRLIATDLDGTLLNDAGSVSERNRMALSRARDAGVRIVVVTARSHYTAGPVVENLDDVDSVVCSNGATIYDPVGRSVIRQHSIEPPALAELFSSVTGGLPGVCFGWETAQALIWEQQFAALHPRPGAIVGPRPTEGVNKVLVAHADVTGYDLLEELRPLLNGGVNASNSGADFVEVTASGIDKGFGLALVCDEWGVAASEVVAFGDQVNDIPMLTWAGIGVAMGNGHPEVIAAANRTAESNERDGVASMLDELLK